jgi:hypothetical protein
VKDRAELLFFNQYQNFFTVNMNVNNRCMHLFGEPQFTMLGYVALLLHGGGAVLRVSDLNSLGNN